MNFSTRLDEENQSTLQTTKSLGTPMYFNITEVNPLSWGTYVDFIGVYDFIFRVYDVTVTYLNFKGHSRFAFNSVAVLFSLLLTYVKFTSIPNELHAFITLRFHCIYSTMQI